MANFTFTFTFTFIFIFHVSFHQNVALKKPRIWTVLWEVRVHLLRNLFLAKKLITVSYEALETQDKLHTHTHVAIVVKLRLLVMQHVNLLFNL